MTNFSMYLLPLTSRNVMSHSSHRLHFSGILNMTFTALVALILLVSCSGGEPTGVGSKDADRPRDGIDLQTSEGRSVIPFEDVVAVQITKFIASPPDQPHTRSTKTFTGTDLKLLLESLGLRQPLTEPVISTKLSGFIRITFKTHDGSAAQRDFNVFDDKYLIDHHYPENKYALSSDAP